MQSRAFSDIFCFPVPFATCTDENLLQAKLAETSLLLSKLYNSSTNTFELNIKRMSFTLLNFRNKRLSGNTSLETNACYRDVESCRYYNVKSRLFSLIISTNMLSLQVHVLHLPSLYLTLRGNCSA